MKKYLSGLITGIALTMLVGSLVIGASAISSRMTIEVDPINVMVNGKVFEPKDVNGNPVPVFAYNGTTMAPLRALAEAYGLEVGYDAEANMASVNDPDVKPAVTPAPDTTAKLDYSDWSAEDEAAYQEFKGLWKDIGTTTNPELIGDINAIKAYATKTPKDKAYSYIKRMTEEYLALSDGFVGLSFWDKDSSDNTTGALLGATNDGDRVRLICDTIWDNVPFVIGAPAISEDL